MGRLLQEVLTSFALMAVAVADMRQPLLGERLGPRHPTSLVARQTMGLTPADNTTLLEGWY
jgi:hypothetical protein